MKQWIYLLISFLSGYLYVCWMPMPEIVTVNNMILELVFNPIMVFSATIALIIGSITNGLYIGNIFESFIGRERMRKSKGILRIVLLSVFYYILLPLGLWQMILFFSFALIYGIMTIGIHN